MTEPNADRPSYNVSMQADPIVSQCSELLRLGLMPSASEIKAGKVCCADPTHWHGRDLTAPSGSAYGGYIDHCGQSKGIMFMRWTLKILLKYK